MFDVDGALVGYGGIAPEPLIEMIAAGKAKDYAEGARAPRPAAAGDRATSITAARTWKARSRSSGRSSRAASSSTRRCARRCCRWPGAEVEIADAMRSAGLGKAVVARPRARRRRSELTDRPDRRTPDGGTQSRRRRVSPTGSSTKDRISHEDVHEHADRGRRAGILHGRIESGLSQQGRPHRRSVPPGRHRRRRGAGDRRTAFREPRPAVHRGQPAGRERHHRQQRGRQIARRRLHAARCRRRRSWRRRC